MRFGSIPIWTLAVSSFCKFAVGRAKPCKNAHTAKPCGRVNGDIQKCFEIKSKCEGRPHLLLPRDLRQQVCPLALRCKVYICAHRNFAQTSFRSSGSFRLCVHMEGGDTKGTIDHSISTEGRWVANAIWIPQFPSSSPHFSTSRAVVEPAAAPLPGSAAPLCSKKNRAEQGNEMWRNLLHAYWTKAWILRRAECQWLHFNDKELGWLALFHWLPGSSLIYVSVYPVVRVEVWRGQGQGRSL